MSENPLRDAISEAITENDIILFMKGTPEAPACGFSARAIGVLQALDVSFASVDILPDPRIRQELSELSQWPTIPQLFVDGELIGGSDIILEMYESGELAQVVGGGDAPAPGGDAAAAAAGAGGASSSSGSSDQLLQPENRLGQA